MRNKIEQLVAETCNLETNSKTLKRIHTFATWN